MNICICYNYYFFFFLALFHLWHHDYGTWLPSVVKLGWYLRTTYTHYSPFYFYVYSGSGFLFLHIKYANTYSSFYSWQLIYHINGQNDSSLQLIYLCLIIQSFPCYSSFSWTIDCSHYTLWLTHTGGWNNVIIITSADGSEITRDWQLE